MKPYSTDLRRRVVQAYEHREGTMRQLATSFRVRVSCVRRLLKHSRETGSVVPKPHGGGAPAKVKLSGLEVVQALVQAAPDATLRELCQQFEGRQQIPISLATMSRVLARLQLTRQKNGSRHGTRACRGAEAAGRLPRGDPRVGVQSAGLCRRSRPQPRHGEGRWPCPSGAACPRR
jgi:transposase